ncbi:galactoside 2-alpha-L-fucosyltransferase 1-like [Lingula anatina]|uniref:L-Fucosyltransferase n=1 Tax=Lingula anatina TaxID=7574 RepID=A0A1S3HUV3_LINAN|nr:galactoside 2-alpha-L-fucosyltransferase 1-like [Lingula anatina]|eukprot:XP_013389822.1 galactoside 2-alpha-L-fucosyltransferase 1-like [Lingula anatina]
MQTKARWFQKWCSKKRVDSVLTIGISLIVAFLSGLLYVRWTVDISACQTDQIELILEEKSPDEPAYLYMPGKGRHGNLMFEYAAAFCIAKTQNRTLIVSPKFNAFLGKAFHLSALEPQNFENLDTSKFVNLNQKPRCCSYDHRLATLPRADITLHGLFHSWLYFEPCKDDIKQEFTFNSSLLRQVDKYLESATSKRGWKTPNKDLVYIGLHVRRGDRGQVLPVHALPHGDANADLGFFQEAMRFYDEEFKDKKVIYVVVSDNFQWPLSMIDHPKAIIVRHRPEEFHMALLSRCNHSIMSVGSIGWWTSWLAGGRVVYYNGWPNPYSNVSHMYRLNQYYYPRWIGMS